MSFLGDIFNLFTNVSGIIDDVDALIHDLAVLVFNIKKEIDKLKAFKFEPKWKTRVINVPAAIDKTRELVTSVADEIHTAFQTLHGNLQSIITARQRHKAEGGDTGVAGILSLMTEIRNFVRETDNAIKSLDSFVNAIREITDELEGLDTLFLQQGNPRQRVTLSATIRTGALSHRVLS
jgi:methyl-accepting chemotaxis protein